MYEMDKVVHFEIPAENTERANKFYSEIFGWKIKGVNMGAPYNIVHTVEVDEKMMPKESGAINGGIFKKTEPLNAPIVIIAVSDVDEYLKKIGASGGQIAREKRAVGDMGFVAYIKDTEGNIVGIWQEARGDWRKG